MRFSRTLVGVTLGAVCASLLSWVGLYLYGVFLLHGKGSIFDTSRTAENIFLILWFVLACVSSIVGGYIGYSGKRHQQ
ncbi:hypothetical protein HDG32_003259 [Paraburkholderia sp. CI2]|nr:hypothetical protein [Paraburkholderia sp. CI2]